MNQHKMHSGFTKIISGGQAGVDRAALDWVIQNNIPHGGWCPKGRRAEDGVIANRYSMQETDRKVINSEPNGMYVTVMLY